MKVLIEVDIPDGPTCTHTDEHHIFCQFFNLDEEYYSCSLHRTMLEYDKKCPECLESIKK